MTASDRASTASDSPDDSAEGTRRAGRPTLGWAADRPVLVKIAAVVLIVAAVAVGVGLTALSSMSSMAGDGDYVYSQNLVPIVDVSEVRYRLSQTQQDVSQYVLASDDPARRASKLDDIKADDAALDAAFGRYTATDMTGREREVARFKQALAEFRAVRDGQELVAANNRDVPGYKAAHSRTAAASDVADAALQGLLTI
jgi:methyl-accepting chemotaxis protein